MRKCIVALSVAMLGMSTGTIWADGIGLTLSGALTLYTSDQVPLRPQIGGTNFLDSANGAVPGGYGNSGTRGIAVIGSGTEFGVSNGQDLVTIDYTGTTVTLTDTCIAAGCGSTPFTLGIYSPYITGYTVLSDNFPNSALGYGDTLYFPNGGSAASLTFFGGSNFTGGSLTASYTSITPPAPQFRLNSLALASVGDAAVVPEPAAFSLIATGLVAGAGLVRRRLRSK